MNNKTRILVVNEDKLAQKSLYEMLCRCEYVVEIANSVKEAVACLNERHYNIILTEAGAALALELLKVIKKKSYRSEIIMLASHGNTEAAVESIKMGAFDYLVRPIEDKKIISAIERALTNKSESEPKPAAAKTRKAKKDMFYGLVGKSQTMEEIYSIVERISNAKTTILLRGESGTGKRMIARAIHKADRKRRDKPFVEISCGALPREIIESELFGHTKGSFTGAINDRKGRFELADGGTMLLDDIDTFPMDLQVKLLRVLQEKEFERVGDNKTMKVDVRVIVSTNQDLETAILEKKFREDLYYRLNVISIFVPPLRERKDDLPMLANYFFDFYSNENHKKIKGISKEAMNILTAYNWPGNVRELENIVERAIILDTDTVIDKDDLPEIILNGSGFFSAAKETVSGAAAARQVAESLKDALKEPEKVYILKILEEAGWNKKKAAERLGVNRTTLYNKLHKYNLFSSGK